MSDRVFDTVTVSVEKSDHYAASMSDILGLDTTGVTADRFRAEVLRERDVDWLVSEWCLGDNARWTVHFTLSHSETGDRIVIDPAALFEQNKGVES